MEELRIVALAGGVGGAKLADGLAQVLQPDHLTVIVNTADDFTHMGLRISPDLDTVCYTLARLANPVTGWGREGETWNAMKALQQIDMPDWFQLGDSDLATHLARTFRLNEGWVLSQVTREFCQSWGVKVQVVPMTDDLVQTWVYTDEGDLGFQEYFVHRHCQPIVKGFRFNGVENSKPAPGIIEALRACNAVVISPSNPWVSIDPILAVPSIRSEVDKHLTIAISPIIANQTVKGPAAKMFFELGIHPSALAIAEHYHSLIDAIVIDNKDRNLIDQVEKLGIHTFLANIFMKDVVDRGRLARQVIQFISADLSRDSR